MGMDRASVVAEVRKGVFEEARNFDFEANYDNGRLSFGERPKLGRVLEEEHRNMGFPQRPNVLVNLLEMFELGNGVCALRSYTREVLPLTAPCITWMTVTREELVEKVLTKGRERLDHLSCSEVYDLSCLLFAPWRVKLQRFRGEWLGVGEWGEV